MTSNPPPPPIKSFADVIPGGYQVVTTFATTNHELLEFAPEGSAKLQVYRETMHDNPNGFIKNVPDAVDNLLPQNPKLLIFETSVFAEEDDRLVALKLTGTERIGDFTF